MLVFLVCALWVKLYVIDALLWPEIPMQLRRHSFLVPVVCLPQIMVTTIAIIMRLGTLFISPVIIYKGLPFIM